MPVVCKMNCKDPSLPPCQYAKDFFSCWFFWKLCSLYCLFFLLSCTTELSCNLHEPSSFLVVWNGMSKAACPSPPSHSIGKSRNSSNLNACSCHVKKATILFTDRLPYDGNLFILHPFLVPAKDKDLKHWNRTVGSCTPPPFMTFVRCTILIER